MMSDSNHTTKQASLASKSASAGLIAAIVASLCCITPVFSLLAGIGGIAATFSWMEPFRPYLVALTLGVLGFAWYLKLKPQTKEEMECACETDPRPSFWQSKRFLGIVTVFATLMLAFPSYSHLFYPKNDSNSTILDDDQTQIKLADFKIKGMTCTGCEEHVKHAVSALDGVKEVSASYKNASAQVKYDASMIHLDQISEAINGTGFTVLEARSRNFSDEAIQPVEFQTLEIPIKGMTCAGCEAHVNSAIGELDGVVNVNASYKQGNAVVAFDPNKVSQDQIVEAVNKTGYKVAEKPNNQ